MGLRGGVGGVGAGVGKVARGRGPAGALAQVHMNFKGVLVEDGPMGCRQRGDGGGGGGGGVCVWGGGGSLPDLPCR